MTPEEYVELRDRIAYLKGRAIVAAQKVAGSVAAFEKARTSGTGENPINEAVAHSLAAKARAHGCDEQVLKGIYEVALNERPADSRMTESAFAMGRVNAHLKRLRADQATQ